MFFPFNILSTETWILLVSAIVLIRLYIHKKWQVLKNLNIPHNPPSVLNLGNMGDLIKNTDNLLKMDLSQRKKFGPVYGSYFGLQPRIVVSDPDILKQIYIKEFSNFRDRQVQFRRVNGKELNTGLLSASGDQWKRIRKTISPTFSTVKLKGMFEIVENCVEKMKSNLHRFAEEQGGRFNAKEVFGKLSMDVLCSSAFSVDVHSQETSESKESKVVKLARSLFDVKLFQNPLVIFFILFPSTEYIAEKLDYSVFGRKTVRYFSSLVGALIDSKQHATTKQRVDIMQQMLKAEVSEETVKQGIAKGLTKKEIIGNSMLMILAGYETTGNAMIFLAYNLATHKEVQEKLRQEIDDAIEKNGKLTYDAVNEMEYLMMCINESLRLYTPLARNARFCENDITINGVHIPKNVQVDVPVYVLSHLEEYWDEPFQFKPERMKDMSKIDPLVFQPFGAGPRSCIAMRFALMEVKMAFCNLLRDFTIDICEDTPEPPLEVTFRASMQPKEEVYLKVVPRQLEA